MPTNGSITARHRPVRKAYRWKETAALIVAAGTILGAWKGSAWLADEPAAVTVAKAEEPSLEPRVRAVEVAQGAQAATLEAIKAQQKELRDDVRGMARDMDTKLDRVLYLVRNRNRGD